LPGVWRWTLVTAATAVVVAGVIAYFALRPPVSGAARVKDLVPWPRGCAGIATHDVSSWAHATTDVAIECEYLGPGLRYARFPSRLDIRRDLLAQPPGGRVCVAGLEVLVDALDPGQFRPLCRRLHGDLVDGVSRLPAVFPDDSTLAAQDRAADAQGRRDTVAELAALRRYFTR
jgi:hypothetical protein